MTEEIAKQIASEAWKSAANAYRMYPENKHTFADYWDNHGKSKATELLSLLPAGEGKEGMRWVKASERLPSEAAPAKMNGLYGVLYNTGNYIEFVGKGFVNSYTLKSRDLSAIEWLDESQSPAIQILQFI